MGGMQTARFLSNIAMGLLVWYRPVRLPAWWRYIDSVIYDYISLDRCFSSKPTEQTPQLQRTCRGRERAHI